MVRRILMAGALAALVGCSSSTTGEQAVVTVATPATTAERAPATLEQPVVPAGSGDPYCAALAGVDALDTVQELAGQDPATAAAAVDAAEASVSAIAQAAPTAVQADWQNLADAYGELFSAYEENGYDFAALMADPRSAAVLERLGGTDLLDAGDRVEQHAEEACGVSVGLGRTTADDDPVLEATGTTGPAVDDSAPVADDDAAGVGALLLEEFGIQATREQQICFGRAVSDPAAVADAGGQTSGDPLDLYRRLAAGCGIDTSAIA